MTPYYSDSHVTLYHGDAREYLSLALVVDAVITDPVWPGASVPLAGSDRPEALFREVVALTAAKRWAVQIGCDTDPAFLACLSSKWRFFRHCWLEQACPSYKGRLLLTGDVAMLYGAPPTTRGIIPGKCMATNSREFTAWRDRSTQKSGKTLGAVNTMHPCPRRLEHVQWLMKWWTAPDELVLDPFCGSGTTLLAAKGGGRRAIGIEIEESHCETAALRLAQGVFLLTESGVAT